MSEKVYAGHNYLELTTAAQNKKIPQPSTNQMAWEESEPGAGDGNAWPTWIEMLEHNYPDDGVMQGPIRTSLDGDKMLCKIMWLPLSDQTFRHLYNAENPASGIKWLNDRQARVITSGPDYTVVE